MKKHRIRHGGKRLLAAVLAIMMVLCTCSGYLPVSDVTGENAGVKEEELPPEPDGDAAPGTIGMLNPYLNGQSLIIYKNESDTGHKQPQIIYGTFTENGQRVTRSLYCIDFAKVLQSGTGFAEGTDYARLNERQKQAVAEVLGKTKILDAPRNAEGGFDHTGNLVAWQEYIATQLLIWYYIDRYYTPGTCEGIGWYGVERACVDGYASLEYCNMVREYVDALDKNPGFAGEQRETAPAYKLKYNHTSGCYETVLTDINDVLARFDFESIMQGMTYEKIGNQLRIRSDQVISETGCAEMTGISRTDMGIFTYVTAADAGIQPLIRCDGAVPKENRRVYLKVYTESLGGIRVYKQVVTHMTTPYSVQGAVYGVFKTKADAEANVNPVAAIRIDRKDMTGNDYGEVSQLAYGTYYVRETEGPQDENGRAVGHWMLDQTVYQVTVKEVYNPELHIGSPASITSREQNYTAAIRVDKESAIPAINHDKMSLIGAVYGVYGTYDAAERAGVQYASTAAAQLGAAAEGAEATIVIKKNPDGIYGQVNGLPLGIYYVREIYAPNGWMTDETIHTADVRKRNTQTFMTMKTLTSRETPEHSIIYVGKTRKENPFDVLGKSFEIGAGGGAIGMLGAEYGVFKTREDAQKAQLKSYDDSSVYEDNRVTTIVTNRTNGSMILGGPDLSVYSVYGESEALPKGTYYIVETKAPKGWLLDRQIYCKTMTEKLPTGIYYALVNSQEVEKSGAIELYKTNAIGGERTADATLKGAKYGIYVEKNPGSSELKRIAEGEIITDDAGYGYIEGLPEGIYYVKEEVASPGYQLDPNIYPVEITPELVGSVRPVVKVESVEMPILTDYEITKITVEDSTGITEPTPLAGCVFGLYLKSELDIESLEKDESKDESGRLSLTFSYHADGTVITEGTVLENVEPYYTATTGKDGKAVFKDCYPGDYLVVELMIGNREDGNTYRAIRSYEVSLPVTAVSGSYKSRETVTLTDEFAGEYLRIQKLDQATGEKINGKVEFRIYDLVQKQYVSLSVNGSVKDRFATDESGCIRFDSRISQGHYRLEEVAAPEYYEMKEMEIRVLDGYLEYRELDADHTPAGEWIRGESEVKDGRVIQIIQVEDKPYQIQVEKVNEAGEPLRGATLAIAYADGKQPAVDADGNYEILKLAGQSVTQQQKAVQSERERGELQSGEVQPELVEAQWKTTAAKQVWEYVPRGNYFLVELEAPDGYAIADPIPFTVGSEPVQTITMMDQRMTGRVAVAKTGPMLVGAEPEETEFGTVWHLQYEQHPMAGITFTIYEEGTDREVCSFVTGSEAVTYSPELDLTGDQKYYMMETAAPAGVVMSTDKYPCKMIYDEDTAGYVTEIIKVENQAMDAELRLYKQGEMAVPLEDGTWTFEPEGLAGVWFGVYAAEDILNVQGEEIVEKDSLVGLGCTDQIGCCRLRETLPAGDYYWKELKTVDGYILEENSYGFELAYPPNQTENEWKLEVNKEQPLMNRLYKARITLNKKGSDDRKLAGVTFTLFRDGKRIGEYMTDADGRIEIGQLPYGNYYFKETKGILGYLFDAEIKYEFAVEAKNNQTIELNVVNEKLQEIPVPITGDAVSMLLGLGLLMTSILAFILINGSSIWRRKEKMSKRME